MALDAAHFFMLALATVLIAAAGYVINDLEDVAVDRINRPKTRLIPIKITEKKAFNYYLLLNVAGVGLGYYLSLVTENSAYAAIFIFISALLYGYATFLKHIPILGNILVSLMVAACIVIVVVFDFSTLITQFGAQLTNPISVLRDYAIFAFMLNFLREIVKDIEDVEGDRSQGINSLPIMLGRERTAKLSSVLALIYTAILIAYIFTFLYGNLITTGYLLFIVGGGLLFFAVKAWAADSKTDYAKLSLYLKIIMILGVLSLGVLSLTLQ